MTILEVFMFKRIIASSLLLVLLVGLAGCFGFGGDSIRGRGAIVTREIEVADFTGINIVGAFEVVFRQGSDFSVTAEMHGNLFDNLTAFVTGDVLRIGFSRTNVVVGNNSPKLYITAPDLESFVVAGAVSANLTGSGDSLFIDIAGAASINAFDFTAKDVVVNVSGAGSVEVYASDTLDVTIGGVGSVNYKGGAELTRSVAGLGSITRVD
jgi:hypothetical protein